MRDFKFNCPHCKQSLEAPRKIMGQKINCPSCKGAIQLPSQTRPPHMPSATDRLMSMQVSNAGCFVWTICVFAGFFVILHIAEDRDYRSRGIDPDELRARRSENLAREAIEERRIKARDEILQSGFNLWDGSHRGLTQLIKESMNEPKSYEHVETTYSDKGDYLIVRTVFRGRNVFGGVVPNWVTAKTDLNGNVIKVIDQSQ